MVNRTVYRVDYIDADGNADFKVFRLLGNAFKFIKKCDSFTKMTKVVSDD